MLFIAALVPVSGLIPFAFQDHSTVADRYVYLAMLGPSLLFGLAAAQAQKPLWNWAIALLLVALAGRTMQQTGHWKSTADLFAHNLMVTPSSGLSHQKLGLIALDDGDTAAAKEHFRQSIELEPHDDGAYQALGELFLGTGTYDSAIHYYERALEEQWLSQESHSNLAVAYVRTGNHSKAIAHFREALLQNPGLCQAHLGIDYEFQRRGMPDSALVHYHTAVHCTEDSIGLFANMARCYADEGNTVMAERYRIRAGLGASEDLEKRPEEGRRDDATRRAAATRLNDSAVVLIQAGATTDAIRLFKKAIAVSPTYENAGSNLRRALLSRGKTQQAVGFFDSLAQTDSSNFAVLLNLGIALRASGNQLRAQEALAAARKLQPAHPEVLNELGIIQARRGELDSAIALFEAAVREDSTFASARNNLTRGRTMRGNGR